MSGLAALTSLIEELFEVDKICNLDVCQTVLYVPVGTIEKYHVTPDWNLFTEIQEIGTNTIEGTVTSVLESDSNSIFDLQGRRLSGQPRNGIYIKDRKKYVSYRGF